MDDPDMYLYYNIDSPTSIPFSSFRLFTHTLSIWIPVMLTPDTTTSIPCYSSFRLFTYIAHLDSRPVACWWFVPTPFHLPLIRSRGAAQMSLMFWKEIPILVSQSKNAKKVGMNF
jgi:hypothetical protein